MERILMSYSDKRRHEDFREALRKDFMKDLWNDERVMSDSALTRVVDADAICKCRLSRYGQQSSAVAKMMYKTEDYNDMQKARDATFNRNDKHILARDFDLDQNVAALYFNAYLQGLRSQIPYVVEDATRALSEMRA